jgi:DNA-binding transcriptional MerR regulator
MQGRGVQRQLFPEISSPIGILFDAHGRTRKRTCADDLRAALVTIFAEHHCDTREAGPATCMRPGAGDGPRSANGFWMIGCCFSKRSGRPKRKHPGPRGHPRRQTDQRSGDDHSDCEPRPISGSPTRKQRSCMGRNGPRHQRRSIGLKFPSQQGLQPKIGRVKIPQASKHKTLYLEFVNMKNQTNFTFGQVVKLTGIKPRTLDNWAATQFLPPSIKPGKGSGTRRLYSFADIVAARAARDLRAAGISLQSLRKVVKELQRKEFGLDHPLTVARLIIVGKDVYLRDNDEFISMLKSPGQAAFPLTILDLGATVERLRIKARRIIAAA